ncbi:hypothetical protein F0562_003534 [Nyssa sinensis]|uniref:BHLH domain-containing protein n=1 Tax=Nyssa sinensis TaxID=561372 RepID=A0A5J5BVR4_9ASTE|nr:hypothetical protein F0562_003534 [Nyssa sinensis]
MDVELLKTSSEDPMEMMTTMMQLDKLPEFFGPYDNTSELPEIEFSGGSATSSIESTPPLFHNPHVNSPSLMSPPSSIPFMGTPVQEPLAPNLVTQKRNSMDAMREMIFRIAVMQPIHIDPESVKPPKRKNVKISKDPQSVAARHRRERISEKIRILQRLVPGGTKMDTASMLDEAIHYVKFLKKQVQSLERSTAADRPMLFPTTTATAMTNMNYSSLMTACQPCQMLAAAVGL